MTTELLLELFSEEIPARMQRGASEQLATKLKDACAALKLNHSGIKTYVTPRRLTAIVSGLPTEIAASESEKRGPKIGAPQGAVDGFCKANNIGADSLEQRDGYYYAVIREQGGKVAPLLQNSIEDLLKGFHWPKSMRWGAHAMTWVRPLQNILCLFDGGVLPVQFGHLKANSHTFGHRFMGSGHAVTIHTSDEYFDKLRKEFVMVDQDERRRVIEEQATAVAGKQELQVRRDPGLLDEVSGLVEWPVVLMGGFEPKYLHLPQEVPTTVMRSHQKYFALVEADGSLAPKFITVANRTTKDDGKIVIAGNERVLRARLNDGEFHWNQDLKTPLADWNKGLADMVFHAKIGSVAEKVHRIRGLATFLAVYVPHAHMDKVERAAEMCKADLTTGMVGEFPELQGLMGRYYALAQNEKPEVADAIRDHYAPLGPDAACPTAPASICVALADKLDTLVGMFAIGEKPTGSKDPFALRRAALGILRIILENGLRLPLRLALEHAMSRYPASFFKQAKKDELESELLSFFIDRLKVMLRDQGIAHDRIEAVIHAKEDDLFRMVARAKSLDAFLKTDDGGNLLAAYRRASNIVRIEEEKSRTTFDGDINKAGLVQTEEKALFNALEDSSHVVEDQMEAEKYAEAMAAIGKLRPVVDAFFDKVTVNTEDEDLRENRLNLLARVRGLLDGFANFAKIEG